jgi:ElaB/YqjD/DUF883 family membrane-anchored ribosome-binding protein
MTHETERLERETEQSRDRVASLLEELKSKATPGDIVNHIIGEDGISGASEMLHRLGEQVRANPMPVALVGAGLAWLMIGGTSTQSSGRKSTSAKGPEGARASAGDGNGSGFFSNAAEKARDSVSGVRERAQDMASSAGDQIGSVEQKASDMASQATETVEQAGRRAIDGLRQMLEEQPLVVAGIAVALGAALGAALPVTSAESRLFGETSEEVKQQAMQAAREAAEKAKEVAEHGFEAARERVKEEAERVAESLPGDANAADEGRGDNAGGDNAGRGGGSSGGPEENAPYH